MKGFEPSYLAALVPQTSVSTVPPHPLVNREKVSDIVRLFDKKLKVI